MRTFNQWMEEYGVSHKNPTNQKIHKICVPLIMLSVIGFFWSIPTPEFFSIIPYFNWATVFIFGCLIFYFTLSLKMFIGMLIQTMIMSIICHAFLKMGYLLPFCSFVFIISWIAQFWGHKIEGKKPSFLQDLAFLLIGPLWVTRFLYKKMGINV
jgi:uncharacterized membrane protein YGL010W